MATIIVAGGSGYIGQEVVRAAVDTRDGCLRGGHTVVNIDISPPRPVDERLRRAGVGYDVHQDPRVRFVQADLSDERQLAGAVEAACAWAGPVHAVCNLVGLVRYGVPDDHLLGPNVRAVQNLVRECVARDVPFLHLSGTAVHGNTLRGKVRETDPVRPVEAYGRSKAHAERVILDAVATRGLRAVVFRATNPVGPRVQLSELDKLYETAMKGPFVPAVRGGMATYVSTTDTGRAFVYAVENLDKVAPEAPEQPVDTVYNLGVREAFSDAQVAAHLVRSIHDRRRYRVVEVPVRAVQVAAFLVTAATRLGNRVLRRNWAPVLHYELAKLFSGSHDQDQSRFADVFERAGFTFEHPTSEEVLDVATVYKFLTDWSHRPAPPRIATLMRRYVEDRAAPPPRPPG